MKTKIFGMLLLACVVAIVRLGIAIKTKTYTINVQAQQLDQAMEVANIVSEINIIHSTNLSLKRQMQENRKKKEKLCKSLGYNTPFILIEQDKCKKPS